jgi:phage terminase large subunit-like protein
MDDLGQQLSSLSDSELNEFLATLTEAEADKLLHDWQLYARPNQQLPTPDAVPGGWFVWLILAGRGFGKTRTGTETVKAWVRQGYKYVNLAGATAEDVRDIMIEGESGILAHCSKDERPVYLPSKRRLEWPNGARSLLFTGEEPNRARGKQSDKLWADEVASWRYPETWDQLMLGLRLGDNPQAVVTTTPRPIPSIKDLLAANSTFVTTGSTYDNRQNLAKQFFAKIITKYEGTRLGRQELNAEVLDDNPRALFTLTNIDANRVVKLPEMARIVVAIDPAVSTGETADDTGIIVAGRDRQKPPHYFVFDDLTLQGKPNEWAETAIRAYREHKADRIVGEVNNGGDMIESTIRNVDQNVAYKAVHATRGKAVRAEPVSALYEQNRVHHVGALAKCEDEMVQFDPSLANQRSPNRMDALVWAITDLMENADGLLDYYADKNAAPVPPAQEKKMLAKDVHKWSEPIRLLQMGITPDVSAKLWPAFKAELSDWLDVNEADKERRKTGEKLLAQLSKKYGEIT